MKLTILLAGENPKDLREDFGPYADKFKRMFLGADPSFSFDQIEVHAGEKIPEPKELEAVIVTGSAAGVYDDLEWMEHLQSFIRKAHDANLPMLGICFGHQIIADALGGQVIKSLKGWGVGRHVYQMQTVPDFFPAGTKSIAVAASHKDQVVTLPSDAKIFLSSKFTPNAGLLYANGTTMSMQPHPEFEIEYSAAIFELRRGNPLSDLEVDAAVKTLENPIDNDLVALALAGFFKSAKMISR
ncbi:MAG: type 1 glutamine amidotransferase [Devosiaceae bacterium]|nr:type 1 glutamine amidotransferase [Devosiaceae bacterium]